MDLSRALNQRLCQSCCCCPMAHHISSSQTPLGRERREDTSHRKASGMTQCVCVQPGGSAVAGAHCTLHALQRHHVHGCGDTLCQEDYPNPSSPLPPGMTFVWPGLYTTLVAIQAVRPACASTPSIHSGHRHTRAGTILHWCNISC